MVFLIFIIILIIFSSIYLIYSNSYQNDGLVKIKSSVDNSYYWVRNLPDKNQAANTLANIKINIEET